MARPKSLNIAEMSYDEVAAHLKTNDTILVSMGSNEKHGAHCPLGTDAFTAMGVIERAAKLSNTLYTPCIPVGYSPHHMGELGQGTGTLTFSGDTYRRVVYDLAKSLIYHGYNKLVFVTHHGSNSKVIDEILRRIRYESGAFVGWYKTPTERNYELLKGIVEGPPEETPGWHAGEIETSTAWAYSGFIDMDKAKPDRTHAPRWMGPAFSKHDGSGMVTFQGGENMWVPMEHHEYSDTATIGNPLRASKEKGLKFFELAAKGLADLLEEVKKFPIKVPAEKREFNNRA
ncbi:MAG: creatininase family protein [Spirochaetia bacterium]|jgi:creatinine amidohydrolase|uniref:Creatininase n=1 Tax=uncultured Spirochaetota bacterium TaxID=460511 RepID=A0A652ZUX5_9SPIR|nr:creatininase family protein [Spirochaetia bacterium]MCE1210272.1 creatininase family protein [Spirochaetia bacterium]VBB39586.1 Creatininase [uncultured Spirochaetota bacterium]